MKERWIKKTPANSHIRIIKEKIFAFHDEIRNCRDKFLIAIDPFSEEILACMLPSGVIFFLQNNLSHEEIQRIYNDFLS